MRATIRSRRRLVVDARVLVDDHFSGIGHYAMSLLLAVDALAAERELDVRLAVPASHVGRLRDYGFRNCRPLGIPLSYWGLRHRTEHERLPPMDLLLGRAVYFFPNYNRWPLRRSRSITAIHDLSFIKLPETVDGPNAEYLRRVVADSAKRSDLITALTHTMASEIVEHYGLAPESVKVVGCAADRRRFYRRSDEEVRRVTKNLGIFGRYVVAVGNIEPRKNQIRLVEAFRSLPSDVRDEFTLVLVGAGAWNQAAIEEAVDGAVADGCRVRLLLGSVSDDMLPAIYSGATCSAYVSRYEGFGMPPLESAACGTPVVASDLSVIPEVVGEAAVFVDPTDVRSITRGLFDMLTMSSTERDALVRAGFDNLARYRWDDAATVLLDAVDELLAAT